MGGCCSCQSVPCPHPKLVGLWISDDATHRENLLANHEYEKRTTAYGCSKQKQNFFYKPCTGAVLEIFPSGYVNYIEMEGQWARNVYSGPITNWEGPDGVWTGCCDGCCCCAKGCVHFDVVAVPHKERPDKIIVNGRSLSKEGRVEVEEVPVVVAKPLYDPEIVADPIISENKPCNPSTSPIRE